MRGIKPHFLTRLTQVISLQLDTKRLKAQLSRALAKKGLSAIVRAPCMS